MQKKLGVNLEKNSFFSLHQNAGQVIKNSYVSLKTSKKLFFWNKTLDQRFGAN